jgi:hypothetical protein
MSTFLLIHPSGLLPFFLLLLVKYLKQVAKLIRRRRNRRGRRRRIRKIPRLQLHQVMLDSSNQIFLIVLGMLIKSKSLKRIIPNPNPLAGFVRVTTL